ncbi:bifunctional adenosylcobinamide kinase/adenosylcobinamide-phosphate guanylyltransferase [Urinicoccus massiliensis]|uniref:bifunctional adenosylcobinamide kinase/adenosylcobinamide-phosphate guanylyltransferase n=1 Tax=Urinicoccus massiliensis TaxID=1723382 RepID=UPI0009311AD3|nr:bifunctional adenosylcobinamide kinase/adenosylcobinamide-phosphate guanylyltransferase [Urinicoccus massiliensis]
MITLITGGARSGKSSFAENLLEGKSNVTYIATSQVYDDEMKERVRQHKLRRPQEWNTWESPLKLRDCPYKASYYLLDCLTLLTTNHTFDILKDGDHISPEMQEEIEKKIKAEIFALCQDVRKTSSHLIMVTNEVGYSIVPENHLSRVFRDIQGRINQYAAELADRAYIVICGQGVLIKG